MIFFMHTILLHYVSLSFPFHASEKKFVSHVLGRFCSSSLRGLGYLVTPVPLRFELPLVTRKSIGSWDLGKRSFSDVSEGAHGGNGMGGSRK